MKEFLKVMKAASDPGRIKILKMLEHRVMCVCEIYTVLGIAQSTTSKHLKILEEAGLVKSYKDGLWVNFTLSDGKQNPYAANLLGNLKHWLNEDADILEVIAILPDAQREIICGK
ncbi:Transcriptional regulator, ArsR family [Desulfamplus magnetovallimortis]|uniref:Transcriptional regulator, ArsR family n=1 Tax=Desulfamplus magnetovallimortis TaxID=1246637 RepID=A0A1W1HIK9_9BACT|nr:metalloregulator ArsR/SmtB family transcription factor [Desulfamplus magnetovallimortis]SLM32270.1 Transcriptional regulator, ArsR family [Desulfamplus magnetovallimortis]